MQIAALAPRNDAVHEPPDFFCLCFRRPYTSICEYRDSQIAQERFTMAAFTTQSPTFFEVTHNLPRPGDKGYSFFAPCQSRPSRFIPRLSPILVRISLISLSDFRPKFRVLSISGSFFCTSSPIVLMLAFFK